MNGFIKRQLQSLIEQRLFLGKAIIVIGPRQVGKSTLLEQVVSQLDTPVLRLDCDIAETRQALTDANMEELRTLFGTHRIVIVDEAQRVPHIGLTLKLVTDNMKDVQLLVSGSSSLQLRDQLDEPLTGRKFEYNLYPLSTKELLDAYGLITVKQNLESRLIYGSYPDVVNHKSNAKEVLMNIAESYLYKDILAIDNLRKPRLLEAILIALALQVGSEVSLNEVAQTVQSDVKTVDRYIDLLEKCYILFRLPAFSRNLRNEIKRSKKIYFYDNGIRNAVLQNFTPAAMRGDMGALWENFFISERIKRNRYGLHYARHYFWRTTSQQEIDYIEEEDGQLTAFELKWNPRRKASLPKQFTQAYSVRQFDIVTPDNYLNYLTNS